ncbi:hypothetical protein HIM_04175 [Hirsutella minnesotensis 3608]|uniref:NAD(P)-binding domain-containing protein n=1 Tax=Hirsutella minnesotensis 3608 TaxID=1043627 RepID=A0A0F7ZLI1_9HYPO|nr:hypothetical protein HIM_04175 [Hirsutella minnesotensis 3608]
MTSTATINMQVLLLGASGRNGSLVLESALARGHQVTALVRSPSTFTVKHKNLNLVKGSPLSLPDLQSALQSCPGVDAVLIALGHRRLGSSPFAGPTPDSLHDLMERAVRTLLRAIEAVHLAKAPKLIINSSVGVGASWGSMILPLRLIFSNAAPMRIGLEDHANVDRITRESGLPFVLARAARLTDESAKPVRVWGEDGEGTPWMASISRASLAEWMVDAIGSAKYDGQAPVLTN